MVKYPFPEHRILILINLFTTFFTWFCVDWFELIFSKSLRLKKMIYRLICRLICGLIFPQQRKLGVFSHSKGSGAGRSSQIRWEPGSLEGSQEEFPFTRESLGAARSAQGWSKVPRNRFPSKVFPRGSQEQNPKQGFPGRGSQQCKVPKQSYQEQIPKQGFPGRGYQEEWGSQAGSKQGSQETGSQARVPRQGFPARGSQARFPGTGFASTDFRNRFQGFQEPFPKQDFQEHAFPSKTRCPEQVFKQVFPGRGFHEEVSKQGSQQAGSQAIFPGRGSQARFPAAGSQEQVPIQGSQEQVHK